MFVFLVTLNFAVVFFNQHSFVLLSFPWFNCYLPNFMGVQGLQWFYCTFIFAIILLIFILSHAFFLFFYFQGSYKNNAIIFWRLLVSWSIVQLIVYSLFPVSLFCFFPVTINCLNLTYCLISSETSTESLSISVSLHVPLHKFIVFLVDEWIKLVNQFSSDLLYSWYLMYAMDFKNHNQNH
jgi:hypothetical protein